MFTRKNISILLLGSRGSGKTYFAEKLLLESICNFRKIICLSCTNDPNDFKDLLENHKNIFYKDQLNSINLANAIRFCETTYENKLMKNQNKCNIIFVDDPFGPTFEKKELFTQLGTLLYNGRHYTNFIINAQDIRKIDNGWRNNFDIIMIKKMRNNNDLSLIYKNFYTGELEKDEFIQLLKNVWDESEDEKNKFNTIMLNKNDKLYYVPYYATPIEELIPLNNEIYEMDADSDPLYFDPLYSDESSSED